MALIIKKSDVERIIDHCTAGLPDEACGILAGKNNKVEKIYFMTNAKPGPAYYEMNAEEQFRVMKDIRESGRVMVGLFHSHPAGHAYPSRMDVEKAYWPGSKLPNYPDVVYVIVSLINRAQPVIRGFSIEEGKVNEVPVSLIEP
ncbi:MAG TPA: M67 family metallopeptidase [Nitrospirota bacterium]|nr:M67 family metallopeptidase [Nitrospirota bacterium]